MGDVGVLQNRPAVSLGQWLQRADSVPRLGVIAFALGMLVYLFFGASGGVQQFIYGGKI